MGEIQSLVRPTSGVAVPREESTGSKMDRFRGTNSKTACLWSVLLSCSLVAANAPHRSQDHGGQLMMPSGGQQQQHQQQNQQAGGNSLDSIQANAGKIISSATLSNSQRPVRHLHDGPRIFIDLSHPLHNGTLHWPKNSGFQYGVQVDGEQKNSHDETYYVKSDNFSTAVHSGTHLDAPRHFSKKGWTVEQIPLERLIDVPVIVIDVSAKVKLNRSYSFVRDDFIDSKTNESLVAPRSVVLVYTGISQEYNKGEKAYFGTDSKNPAEMKIPGFSQDAASYMVERGVYGVGLDSPSADSSDRHNPGGAMDLIAHITLNANNIYILENISDNLKDLLGHAASEIRLTIAPLPVVSGSGSPIRLIATIGHEDCHCAATNSASNNNGFIMAPAIVSLISISLPALLVSFLRRQIQGS